MDGMEGEKGKQLYFNLVNCLSLSLSRPQSLRSLSHEVLSPPPRPLVNLDLRTRTPFQRESFSGRAEQSRRRPLRFRNISLLIKSGNKSTFAQTDCGRETKGKGQKGSASLKESESPANALNSRIRGNSKRCSVKTFHDVVHILHIIQAITFKLHIKSTNHPSRSMASRNIKPCSMGPASLARRRALLLSSRAADFNQIVSKIDF